MKRAWMTAPALIWLAVLVGGATIDAQSTPNAAEQAAAAFKDDVHAKAGLTCEACHGGRRADGVFAPIARTAIAPLCAKCHADATVMRKFAPQLRVDQFAQYQTSVHGKQMAKGVTAVATCSDCHHAHGIVSVRDPRSPVAPLHVAQTCAQCHADAARMAPFNRSPDIFNDWSQSVHADALLKRGDTSAPTCNTCHGSHGATPPGVDAVANVCAQCHVREADLFKSSPHAEPFAMMGQGDCIVCHSNHRIEAPNQTWIGLESPAVCATCHDATSASAPVIKDVRQGFDDLSQRMTAARTVLNRAETAGMLVEEGQLALHDATQASVQMRVLVHGFATPPFDAVLKTGREAADKAQGIGDQAMAELQYRRRGLAVATLVILGFLGTLYVKIRRLPPVR